MDVYWVGGTGNWSDPLHWSATSGGGSRLSCPVQGEDIVIDIFSGAGPFQINVDIATPFVNNISINDPELVTILIKEDVLLYYGGDLVQANGSILFEDGGQIAQGPDATASIFGTFGNAVKYRVVQDGTFTFESGSVWVHPIDTDPTKLGFWYIHGNLNIAYTCTVTHNNFTFDTTYGHSFDIFLNNYDTDEKIYRIRSTKTGGTVRIEGPCKMNGIYFTSSAVFEANTEDVTLTGITPSLGDSKYHSRSDLLEHGWITEVDDGRWVFDYDFSSALGYMILRGLASAYEQELIIECEVERGIDYLASQAIIMLHDVDRSKITDFPRGCQISIYWFNGSEWTLFFKAFVLEISTTGKVGSVTRVFCPGYDWFLRKEFFMDFDHRVHTLIEMLEYYITFHTPFIWNSAKISMANPSRTVSLRFDGEVGINAIVKILSYSDNEEFGIDLDREFFVQQRATSHDGTRDATEDIVEGTWESYTIDDNAKDGFNQVQLVYDSSTERRARFYSDYPILIDTWNSQLDLDRFPTKDDLIVDPTMDSSNYALVEDLVQKLYTLRKPETVIPVVSPNIDLHGNSPSEIIQLNLTEVGITNTAKKIAYLKHKMSTMKTTLTLIDPAQIIGIREKASLILTLARKQSTMQFTSEGFSFWNLISFIFDTQSNFLEFTLYSTGAVHADGYIYATGNTSGLVKVADVVLLSGASPSAAHPSALESSYSNYRRPCCLQLDMDQNGGAVEIRLNGTQRDEYEDLRDIMDDLDGTDTLEIWMNWNGITGSSPKVNYIQLSTTAWEES